MYDATKQAVWLKQLLEELNLRNPEEPVTIYGDNKAAIKIAEKEQISNKTKHISIKYHYVRDMINNNQIKMEYVNTDEMLADTMTKPLAKDKFIQFRSAIGMVNDIPNWGGVLEQ